MGTGMWVPYIALCSSSMVTPLVSPPDFIVLCAPLLSFAGGGEITSSSQLLKQNKVNLMLGADFDMPNQNFVYSGSEFWFFIWCCISTTLDMLTHRKGLATMTKKIWLLVFQTSICHAVSWHCDCAYGFFLRSHGLNTKEDTLLMFVSDWTRDLSPIFSPHPRNKG